MQYLSSPAPELHTLKAYARWQIGVHKRPGALGINTKTCLDITYLKKLMCRIQRLCKISYFWGNLRNLSKLQGAASVKDNETCLLWHSVHWSPCVLKIFHTAVSVASISFYKKCEIFAVTECLNIQPGIKRFNAPFPENLRIICLVHQGTFGGHTDLKMTFTDNIINIFSTKTFVKMHNENRMPAHCLNLKQSFNRI